jgi:hypothetical protein
MAFEDKWVRIMADWSADGVWDSEGCGCSADSLPISDNLRQRLRDWQAMYDATEGDPGLPQWPNGPDKFAHVGLAIAKAVKRELPDWTVIFHDEAEAGRSDRRERYEYEII